MFNKKLIEAEKVALELFKTIENLNLIIPGKTEKQLSDEIFDLAKEKFGITKYWHKRIVRSGMNTLLPYAKNPRNLTIQKDDIIFIDFGPILEQWEADIGRTYVIGNDLSKLKLKEDVESIWKESKTWFDHQENVTGAEFWSFIINLTENKYNYHFGGEIGGHIIGLFPHENIKTENLNYYIHPKNQTLIKSNNVLNQQWILEIHIVNPDLKIGAFFEQLLTY